MNRSSHELPQTPSSDWEAYKPFRFTPKGAQFEMVEERNEGVSPETAAVMHEMIDGFQSGAPDVPYWQLPRMGRACFAPVQHDSDIVATKGALGRSPGSDSIQRLQNIHWRSLLGENAGWTALEIKDDLDFMILHRPGDSETDPSALQEEASPPTMLMFAAPVGYASFKQLLREYRTLEQLIEPANIPTSRALALLRREISLPWRTEQEAKQYLADLFREKQQLAGAELQEFFDYTPSARLDSGLLFRSFKTAVRPQDHYDRAIEGKWGDVHNALSASLYSSENLLRSLASAAGKLMEQGIVHGQLFYDYQNITTAGEVCDVELAVVAPSVNPALAKRFTTQLSQDDDRFGVKIVDHYNTNIQRIAPDSRSAGRSLLEQGYYLFDTVVRSMDIEQRASGGPSEYDRPGTVLNASQIHELRQRFTSEMVDSLRERGRHILSAACRADVDVDFDFKTPGGGPLLREVLDGKNSTIYGWTSPSRPFDNYGIVPGREDIEFIIDDFSQFAKMALAQVNR